MDNPGSDLRLVEASIPNSYYREIAGHKYLGLDGRDVYLVKLHGEALGTFTLEIDDVLNDQIIGSNVFVNIPVTEDTIGELILSENSISVLTLDIDGDGNDDISINPNEEQNSDVSLEILNTIINSLDILKGLKTEITTKIEKAQINISKGNQEKAVKYLENVIMKLEKDIRENTKHDELGVYPKILTEDAERLIKIIEKIIEEMV